MHHHSNPRSLLTPQMRGVIDRMARAASPMHALSAEQAKAFYEAGSGVLDIPAHKMARTEDLRIPVRDGATIASRLVAPVGVDAQQALPVLMYVHGGGFTVGSVNTHHSLCCHLAQLAHCAVLSVDYRLAPEHRFPTAVNDVWDAFAWLHHEAPALGLDPQRVAVGGDSAGGTLSLVTAVQARDAGLPLRLQMLFYPGCAAHQDTPSHKAFAHGFVLEEASITWFFSQYLNHAAERDDWRFSPLNIPELEGLAPAWIGLAECDPLVDEGVRYADTLRMAGVPVDLEIYRGVIHGFITMGRAIPDALKAHADAGRALKHAFES